LRGNDNEGENTPSDVDSAITQSIEREIEQAISDIKSGKHPELQQNLEALERVKQKKIEASDRHRKMQIKNINALFDYEVEDANALYKVRIRVSCPWVDIAIAEYFTRYLVYRKHTLRYKRSLLQTWRASGTARSYYSNTSSVGTSLCLLLQLPLLPLLLLLLLLRAAQARGPAPRGQERGVVLGARAVQERLAQETAVAATPPPTTTRTGTAKSTSPEAVEEAPRLRVPLAVE
jgi:hypothetical protein